VSAMRIENLCPQVVLSLVPELDVVAMSETHQLEPIPLPNVDSLDTMPTWPAWVAERAAAISRGRDKNAAGHYCNGPWMPAQLIPSFEQRALIERHVDALKLLMDQTPKCDRASEKATNGLITKLLHALSGQRTTEAAIAARAEAFTIALETDPWWAVAAAIRGWYRGKYGKEHDYRWAPAPAVLHELATREAWKIWGRVRQLEDILTAEAPLTFSDEHRKRMLMRLAKEIPEILGTRHERNAKTSEAV
jgi:hypothetical protein